MAIKKLKPYAKSGLYRAIVSVGGLTEMARALTNETNKPVSRQTVFNWRKYGRIPSWYVEPIHRMTNISLLDLLEPYEPEVSVNVDDE